MIWRNPGHEFDDVAKIICDDNAEFYLWGAGNGCRDFIDSFGGKIKIKGILDSNKSRTGEIFCGYSIVELDSLKDKNVIVTTSDYYKEIIDFLEENGLTKNRNYFLKKEFAAVYLLYKEEKLAIDWMNLIVTDRCSLKCKDCIMFSTYFTKPEHQALEELKNDVDLVFDTYSYIENYQMVGGEPLIYPELENIIEYVGENYRGSIGDFLITTNGTILPPDSFFEKCARYDMTIRLSDYSLSANFFKKQMIEELVNKLQQYGVNYEMFGTGVWHDFGDPRNSGKHTREELIHLYQVCDCVHSTVRNGKWYTCCRQAAGVWSGMCEDKDDCLDLKQTGLDRKVILEYYLKYCKRGWLTCCEACYGDGTIMMNREVPAAEQME